MKWFQRKGIIFLPVSFAGLIIAGATIAYTVFTFIDIDRRSHSVSDTLINFIFNLLIIAVIYSLLAYISGKIQKKENN